MVRFEGGIVVFETTWAAVKDQIDTRKLDFRFEEDATAYEIFAVDEKFLYSTVIYKSGQAPQNQATFDIWRNDFEANYKNRIVDFNNTEPVFISNVDGYSVVLKDGSTPTVNDGYGIALIGYDGYNYRMNRMDSSGRQIIAGSGTPGSSVGGVVSVHTPDTTGTGTLNALNATASIDLTGTFGCAFQLSAGTLIGTIVPEVSYDDGTTWNICLFQDPTSAIYSSSIIFTAANGANSKTIVIPSGASNARVRVSLFTSGTAIANIRSTISGNVLPGHLSNINTINMALGKFTSVAATLQAIRQTTFVEQSTNTTRSYSSSSVNDASAGTGARTVLVTYLDASFAGPFTTIVTLNGTSATNTIATNICYIESIKVLTTGSGGSNAGIISFFTTISGGGGTIATIAVGDNRTFWAHHYVPSGKNCYITEMHGANSDTTNRTLFTLKAKSLVANSAEIEISGIVDGGGSVNQGVTSYATPIMVPGPARIVLYGTPASGAAITNRAYFSYYDL